MTTYRTGNAIGSADPRDLYDNAQNLDEAVNSDDLTFRDRLGNTRLTLKGYESAAGSGDVAVQAAARALEDADRAEAQADRAEQEVAEGINQGVSQVTGFATAEADRAEAARDAAFVNADVYADTEAGRAAVANGEQFQVVEGDEVVRYRRVSSSSEVEVARWLASAGTKAISEEALLEGVDFYRSSNLFDAKDSSENLTITVSGDIIESDNQAISGWIRVEPGSSYTLSRFDTMGRYTHNKEFINRSSAPDGQYIVPSDTYFIRLNYFYRGFSDTPRFVVKGVGSPASDEHASVTIPSLKLIDEISPEQTKFLKPSVNLFNRTKAEPGIIDLNSGEIVPSDGYFTSDFIKVTPGKTYSQLVNTQYDPTRQGFLLIGRYTDNRVFMGRTGTVNEPFESYENPAEVGYIRLVVRGTTEGRMFVEGSTPPAEFVEYGATLSGVRVGSDGLFVVGEENIANGSVTKNKTDFIEPSLNLFDQSAVTDGKVISVTGEIVDSDNYRISDYISVQGGETYSTWGSGGRPFAFSAEYDAEGEFIARYTLDETRTVHDRATFVRIVFSSNQEMDRVFYKGTDEIDGFIPHTNYIRGVTILSSQIEGEIASDRDRYMIDTPLDGLFTDSEDYSTSPDIPSLSAAQVYALWDGLSNEFPDYITKESLGDDDFGNPIALYRMRPPRPITPFADLPRPTVFVVAGIHGGEKVPPFATWAVAEKLCRMYQADELLEAVRFNVELLVIPVACPSAWDANSRANGNGVDINRNFPEGWILGTPGEPSYGGPEPLSEPEAQYISGVLEDNRNIDIFCDFHNFGQDGGTGGSGNSFIWVSSVPSRRVVQMAQILSQKLTRHWRSEYEWIPDDETWFAGYATASSGMGLAKSYAHVAHGVELSATFEVCNRWKDQPGQPLYSQEVMESSVEAFFNWLTINVNEAIRTS